MDQAKFLNIVRRYGWLFVVAAVVASLVTFFVYNRQPLLFEAKTRLLVGPTVDSPSPDLNSLRIGGQLMQTYADLVTTRPFLESINNKLDQKINLEALSGMIETRQNTEARILTIYVHHQDPRQAVAIANAAAQSLIEISPAQDNTTSLLRSQMSRQSQQLEQVVNNAEASIQELEAQLAALADNTPESPEAAQAALEQKNLIVQQISDERARLSEALRMLTTIYQVLLGSNTNQLQIIEPAGAVFPVNPNLPLRMAVSAFAGMLLLMSLVFAYEYFNDTIRVPGDFSRTVKAPLLSSVEKHNHWDAPGLHRVVTFAEPNSPAANSYRTAVTKLLFSLGKSAPHAFLVSSIGSQSGDTTALATANLGVAFAQAGNRVILVDAQLNNPGLTKLFEANGKAGLYDLLSAKSSELKLMSIKEMADIQLLPAGAASEKWSGAMLNFANIIKWVEELRKEADIVLFAGSPISGSAESLALASQVNGVILVARYGDVHSKLINDVAESLNAVNVPLAGVILQYAPSPFVAKRYSKKVSTVAPAEKSNLS